MTNKVEGAKWYMFDQNNSGGYYIEDDRVASIVFVQAMNAREANDIFSELAEDAQEYCDCCGERWSHVDEDDGFEEPTRYGENFITESNWKPWYKNSYALFHGLNGRTLKYDGVNAAELGKLSNGL